MIDRYGPKGAEIHIDRMYELLSETGQDESQFDADRVREAEEDYTWGEMDDPS
jgi:hypothetical protein